MLELTANSDERITIIGQTRMGKTFLIERLAAKQPRFVVVDSKHRVNWKDFHLTSNPAATHLRNRIIYRPPSGRPPDSWWEHTMYDLHDKGGGVIYVDEGPVVCTANRIPDGMAKVYRVGGELGVAIWMSSQESTTIHNTTMRQSNQIIMFYNQGASDRDKLARITGDMAEVTGKLHEYQFVVFVRGETYDADAVPVYQAVA